MNIQDVKNLIDIYSDLKAEGDYPVLAIGMNQFYFC